MKRFSSVLFAITFTIQFLFSQSATAQEKDFVVKGFHLDLRIQVMKMDALKAFAKKLSESGNKHAGDGVGSYLSFRKTSADPK